MKNKHLSGMSQLKDTCVHTRDRESDAMSRKCVERWRPSPAAPAQ